MGFFKKKENTVPSLVPAYPKQQPAPIQYVEPIVPQMQAPVTPPMVEPKAAPVPELPVYEDDEVESTSVPVETPQQSVTVEPQQQFIDDEEEVETEENVNDLEIDNMQLLNAFQIFDQRITLLEQRLLNIEATLFRSMK